MTIPRSRFLAGRAIAGLLVAALLSAGCTSERSPQPEPATSSEPTAPSALETAFEATPSFEAEQKRLGTEFHPNDAQPTGYYLPADVSLTVTVDRPDDGPVPELLVGTYGLDQGDTDEEEQPRAHLLADATTVVTDTAGGMLYVRYTSDDEGTAPPITLRFGETARPVPFHVLGETPAQEWQAQLAEAEDVPVAQFVSEHLVLTVHLDSARRNAGQDPDALLRAYERILAVQDAISGLDGEDPRDRRSPLRYFVSEGKPNINPNAYYDRVVYPADSIDEALNVSMLNENWGMWHELGHMHQQASWDWDAVDEVTVNIYSLAVQRDLGQPTRLAEDGTPEKVHTYLSAPDAERDYNAEDGDLFVRLAMFEQLRLAFGDGFYPELHKLTRRSETAADPEQYLVVSASQASGHDLVDFFTTWGVPVTDATRAEVAALQLPAPDEDPATLPIDSAAS
ncbi:MULTISPECIES: M60 family metallopeptidase [Streptomyces]|uniref:Peptidase M60 domain-containing protein n=1 Tax=Streptomyces viridochromogenes TaxID=1938 RepID=A0A0L8LEQ1_STRVR|nr:MULTISPECIES: M60 family metallopeptidase [Streptomyces]KOG36589.1 hypothetical protein ADK34_01260 [Streptomyces viridochromogenes]